ncbi:hypothetical protein GCM10018780_82090 [Streptomyces lanatus]|nr:hypothetical protein GCM10018780_82090 [Streptomyces lanatus]
MPALHTTASLRLLSLACKTTDAPRRTRPSAIARPIPDVAPATRALRRVDSSLTAMARLLAIAGPQPVTRCVIAELEHPLQGHYADKIFCSQDYL